MASVRDVLTRMFSNSLVVSTGPGGQVRTMDVGNVQSISSDYVQGRYRRMYSSAEPGSGWGHGYGGQIGDQHMAGGGFAANRLQLFRDYECLAGDTQIPVPGPEKSVAIRELAERYPDRDSTFDVFSYDHSSGGITIGTAHSVRKTKTEMTYRIEFENGDFEIATANHPFMMRDGTYTRVDGLKPGDSVMPFYRKDFYGEGYTSVYDPKDGWMSTHRLIAERTQRPLGEGEVVHHIDFDKTNNLPDNLRIMQDSDHRALHARINNEVLWSEENRAAHIAAIKRGMAASDNVHTWNGARRGENNPFYGQAHSEASNRKRSKSLKAYYTDNEGAQAGENNGNYRVDLTPGDVLNTAADILRDEGYITRGKLAEALDCSVETVDARRAGLGCSGWREFQEMVRDRVNHTIKSITEHEVMDVYDMTVEEHHNFATSSCFVHNSMDQDPIISSALDVYADEISTTNEYGEILRVKCENGDVKNQVENLLFNVLDVDYNLRWWSRSMLKYGDSFLKLHVNEEHGVFGATPMSPYVVQRHEPQDHRTRVQFFHEDASEPYENWEVAHFRLQSDSNFFPYGRPIIENARMIWKQLRLTEEAMLIHRIMRAPEKRIFKIDVGGLEPDAIDSYMNDIIMDVQQTPLVDPQSGQYNLEFNLQNMLEDFFFPVRGNQTGTEVQSLQGLQYQAIEDVEYLRQKMMSGLRIPNAFLGYEREIQGKATLAQESLKFAGNVRKLQRMMKSELEKIAAVDLIAKGYDAADVTSFQIKFTNPSIIAEQERIDFLSRKLGVARDAVDNGFFSTDWVYRELFDMSDQEIRKQRRLMVNDMKRTFRREQIEREGNDPVKTGQSFGTPADLAMSGASSLRPLNIMTGEAEAEAEERRADDPEGVDTGDMQGMKNQLGVRDQDVRPQYSQGGSPLAISSLSDAVNRRHSGLIQETLDGGNLILESEDRAEEDALERGISFMDEDALRVFDDDAASHVLEGAGVDADA